MDFQPQIPYDFPISTKQYPHHNEPLFTTIASYLKALTERIPPREPLSKEQASHRSYKILCPEETAVFTEINGEKHYIHGNVIGDYILMQAPLKKDFLTFWKICMDHSNLIVDLTCHEFEPIDDYHTEEIGLSTEPQEDITVTCLNIEEDAYGESTLYTLKLTEKSTGKEKIIYRINFDMWLDTLAIPPDKLSRLIQIVNSYAGKEKIIIHCRIGVGRTGTFVTAREVDKLITTGKIFDPHSLTNQTLNIILAGRQARNRRFVQNSKQLRSIFEFAQWKIENSQKPQEKTSSNFL